MVVRLPGVLYGDPAGPELWKELDEYLLTPTRTTTGARSRGGGLHRLGRPSHDAPVYAFCNARARQRRKIWAIKGVGGAGRVVWPKRATKLKRNQGLLFAIGVDSAKDTIYARLRNKEHGPGYSHFPEGRDKTYFEQLTAETCVTKHVKGFPVRIWQKRPTARNEALDVRVYGYAALLSLSVSWERELRKALAAPRLVPELVAEAEAEAPTPPTAVVAPAVQQGRRLFSRRSMRSQFMDR